MTCTNVRGMTLLEVVLSITLLASLMLVLTSWTRLLGSMDRATGPARWDLAAEAVLYCIQEDLLTGDFVKSAEPSDRGAARVRVEDGELLISTRRVRNPGGPALHVYGRDATRRELTLRDGPPVSGRSRPTQKEPRVILTGVSGWMCEIVGEDGHELFVTIQSDAGRSRSRRFRLP